MCPRGEVGASLIYVALELGVEGPIVFICVIALLLNLCSTAFFIETTKILLANTYGDIINEVDNDLEFVTP